MSSENYDGSSYSFILDLLIISSEWCASYCRRSGCRTKKRLFLGPVTLVPENEAYKGI